MYFNKLPFQKYKIQIINDWYFKKLETNVNYYTNLSKKERKILQKHIPFKTLTPLQDKSSKDNSTRKVLFKTKDGYKIESVLMQFKDNRNSVCVSSQIGCPVGCKFCATGKMGFFRNLSYKEIIEQVLYFARKLKNDNKKITNVVFMGMGEPMLNLSNVIKSIKILTDKNMFNLGARHITLSSSGYVPQLYEFLEKNPKVRLAISLHSANQKLREKLMPVAKLYPLEELFEFLEKYWTKTNKRVSFEYILIDQINDTKQDALQLVQLLKNKLAHINLIPYNPINEVDFKRSTISRIQTFKKILDEHKIPTTLRITMGDDIKAACGQLATKTKR